MRNRICKLLAIGLSLTMLVGGLSFVPPMKFTVNLLAAPAQKAPSGNGFDIYVDSNGDVVMACNDKYRSSGIIYKTWSLTFSRGQFNPSMRKLANGADTDSFTIPINFNKVTEGPVINGRIQTEFRISYAELKGYIGATSGEWLQEIEDAEKYGATAYIRCDFVMMIHQVNNRGEIISNLHNGHRYRNDPTVGPYDDEARDLNPREIQAAEPWSAGANTGLRTHFHRWLPITSALPMIPPVKFVDHHVTAQNEGGAPGPGGNGDNTSSYYGDYSGTPAYAGGNYNAEGYNASEGIPSTSTITGLAEASPWYGGVDVWTRMVSKQIETFYRYKWVVEKPKLTDRPERVAVMWSRHMDISLSHGIVFI